MKMTKKEHKNGSKSYYFIHEGTAYKIVINGPAKYSTLMKCTITIFLKSGRVYMPVMLISQELLDSDLEVALQSLARKALDDHNEGIHGKEAKHLENFDDEVKRPPGRGILVWLLYLWAAVSVGCVMWILWRILPRLIDAIKSMIWI